MANASDVSDVETVVPSNALFSVDVNIDNLKFHLADLRSTLSAQEAYIRNIEQQVNKRATEKVVGMYMNRIAQAVPKAIGERPHAFKLNDPGFFEEDFDTEDGHLLK